MILWELILSDDVAIISRQNQFIKVLSRLFACHHIIFYPKESLFPCNNIKRVIWSNDILRDKFGLYIPQKNHLTHITLLLLQGNYVSFYLNIKVN